MAVVAERLRFGRLRKRERREFLEGIYERFTRWEYLGTDPLQLVYEFEGREDRELVGIVAACLAYGNVKSILKGVSDVLERMGGRPAAFLECAGDGEIRDVFGGFRYRVTSGERMGSFLCGLKRMMEVHGSLEEAFGRYVGRDDETVIDAMGRWVDELVKAAGDTLGHLVAHPGRGSACKRLNLYLRWMVREDVIDPGVWRHGGARAGQLVVPVDTHMHGIARRLGFTRRKGANLGTAIEITKVLREACEDDPCKYDFALTRPGIMGMDPGEGMR